MFTILFIAIGLSMDVFAVSISSGLTVKNMRIGGAMKMAVLFGLFHIIMIMTGWLAGISLKMFITNFDHWIAFGLLSFVGGKMIYEALTIEAGEKFKNVMNAYVLLILSIATSLDALAVGLSFAMLNLMVVSAAIIIGGTVFILSLVGVYIGSKIGHFFESKMEIAGGIILITIGIKILIEHFGSNI